MQNLVYFCTAATNLGTTNKRPFRANYKHLFFSLNLCIAMSKHFEKGKKEARRFDDLDELPRDDHKKKKSKMVEKTKYRQKNFEVEEGTGWS